MRARGAQGRAREGVPRAPWGPPGFPLGPLALMGAPLFLGRIIWHRTDIQGMKQARGGH